MDNRSFASGASATPPTAPASPSVGYPTGGNPGTATPPTNPGDYWFHQIGEELRAVIAAGGLIPNPATLTQLRDAILALAGGTRSSTAVLAPGSATAATGTVAQSGWEQRPNGVHRQWAVIQMYDDSGATPVVWTLPNPSLFAVGVVAMRWANLAPMTAQGAGGGGGSPIPCNGVVALGAQSATSVTLWGRNTEVNGTKFWAYVEVEGF